MDDPRPSWLRNAWYVAAAADEVGGAPLGRQICGERMVFFRTEAGEIAALDDFCPHRGAPLSLGFVRGDQIVCGYHGLALNCTGRAAEMPGQRVGGFPAVRVFPAIERYGFIWVWPGDAQAADPAALPHLAWAESAEWAFGGGLYHIACDYRLMVDNLMDLTHETYVHASSIGQKEIDEAPVRTRVESDEVLTERLMEGVTATPFWRDAVTMAGLSPEGLFDRWQRCHFTLPSHVMIEVGVAPVGDGGYGAPSERRVGMIVTDFITPETETSHWYFWGMARQYAVADTDVTDRIREGQGKIFSEDLAMLEQQQRNLLHYPERPLLKLNIDAGGVRSRMMIDRAIAAEAMEQRPA